MSDHRTTFTSRVDELKEGIAAATAAEGPGTVATLPQTPRMNNVDPLAWLTQTLERIANGWPSREINALMPWNYAA